MGQISWSGAIIAGIIGLVVGLASTYVVSVIIPTTNLSWSLIAVSFASFAAAFAGYIVGVKMQENEES